MSTQFNSRNNSIYNCIKYKVPRRKLNKRSRKLNTLKISKQYSKKFKDDLNKWKDITHSWIIKLTVHRN